MENEMVIICGIVGACFGGWAGAAIGALIGAFWQHVIDIGTY